MSNNILTEEEIQRLLDDLDKKEKEDVQIERSTKSSVIQTYDFERPSKLSKDQMRTLQVIHEEFSQLVSTNFSAMLGRMVTIDFNRLREVTYADYLSIIDEPVNMVFFRMSPLEGRGIIEVKSSVAFLLIDQMLGGKGENIPNERETSSLERSLLLKVLQRVFDNLATAWEHICEVSVIGEKVETKPQFMQFVPLNESVILADFQLKIDEHNEPLRICIPYSMIEPVVYKMSSNVMIGNQPSPQIKQKNKENIIKHLEGLHLPVEVILGKARLTIRDILDLEENDAIKLDTLIGDNVSIKMGDAFKFEGKLGIDQGKYIVRVEKRIKERSQ